MHSFIYDALPVRVVFGAGAARTELASEVERLGASKVLLITSSRDAAPPTARSASCSPRPAGTPCGPRTCTSWSPRPATAR